MLVDEKNKYFLDDGRVLFNLIIPSIRFNMGIYEMDSELNNVDYNIEILSSSNLENNLFFIAGHSGRGDNCYFNKIKELSYGEYIYLWNDNEVLIFKVVDKYFIVKDGDMLVKDDRDVLYLITCDIYNSNRQLIIKGFLVNNH